LLTVLYSICPFIFLWSTTILTEALSAFEIVLLMYLTVSYIKKPNNKFAILIGIQLLIMVMTRPANVYLLPCYLVFWILKYILERKDSIKSIIIGTMSTVFAIIITLLYCNQVRNQYGSFGLTNISYLNNFLSVVDSKQYKYGDNQNIINDLDQYYIYDELSVWKSGGYIVSNYSVESIKKFINSAINNNRKRYIKYMVSKAFSQSPKNIGTIYVSNVEEYNGFDISNISSIIFPITFGFAYVILFSSIICFIIKWIKSKRIDWVFAACIAIIFGNLFVSICLAPFETQRLSLISIPILLILFPYLLNNLNNCDNLSIVKSNKSKKKKKTRKKNSNKNISEFFEYVFALDFYKLFKKKTDNTIIQFFRYLFVGGIAAVVNIGMLYVFTDVMKIHYIISNILSFTLGLIVNYILSKKFVFQEKVSINKSKEFIIYAIIGIIGLGIDTLLMWLFTDVISIYYMLSKLISTMLVFIWNFGARKVLYKIIK